MKFYITDVVSNNLIIWGNRTFSFKYVKHPRLRKLYERIRKNFVRISSELGLYMFNGKRRPMYSIRHMNALKLYEDLKDINLVAQALNTSPDIVKSNYLNYSDEWARNRFKVLGYNK